MDERPSSSHSSRGRRPVRVQLDGDVAGGTHPLNILAPPIRADTWAEPNDDVGSTTPVGILQRESPNKARRVLLQQLEVAPGRAGTWTPDCNPCHQPAPPTLPSPPRLNIPATPLLQMPTCNSASSGQGADTAEIRGADMEPVPARRTPESPASRMARLRLERTTARLPAFLREAVYACRGKGGSSPDAHEGTDADGAEPAVLAAPTAPPPRASPAGSATSPVDMQFHAAEGHIASSIATAPATARAGSSGRPSPCPPRPARPSSAHPFVVMREIERCASAAPCIPRPTSGRDCPIDPTADEEAAAHRYGQFCVPHELRAASSTPAKMPSSPLVRPVPIRSVPVHLTVGPRAPVTQRRPSGYDGL